MRRQLKEVVKVRSGPGSNRNKPDTRKGDRHKTAARDHGNSGKSGHKKTLFERGFFVAWDGEGITLCGEKAIDLFVDSGGNKDDIENPDSFTWHIYTSLACGWFKDDEWFTDSLETDGLSPLKTRDIFKFMLRIHRLVGNNAIHVGYYLGYDFVHMLRDLEPEEALIATTSGSVVPGWHKGYYVRFGGKKDLRIGEYSNDKSEKEKAFHLWDVAGFFQSSFLSAVEKWLGKDYQDLDLLRQGKAGRGDFSSWKSEDIAAYNEGELKALVRLMQHLRGAVIDAGFALTRWDGAGALATSFYKRRMKKGWFVKARENTPKPVWDASLYAYFGGRIEYIRHGLHRGYLWHGDITSAYPAAMTTVPDLTSGTWTHTDNLEFDGPIQDFALYLVKWHGTFGEIGAFPFRLKNGGVLFSTSGTNWVWGVELKAAIKFLRGTTTLSIYESWIFTPDDLDSKPFGWIRDIFDLRQAAIADMLTGKDVDRGKEKVLKLGLNSLYGKTIQRIGYRKQGETGEVRMLQNERVIVPTYSAHEEFPAFYHPTIGGYITACCRAQLLTATVGREEDVIAFATDGIFATRPLNVPTADKKTLGLWEVEEFEDVTFIMVQPGVYYLCNQGRWTETIRGFGKASKAHQSYDEQQQSIARRVGMIVDSYRRKTAVPLEETRLITLRSALTNHWAWRGQFVTKPRGLKVIDASSKRGRDVPGSKAPSCNMVPTTINDFAQIWMNDGEMGSLKYVGLPPQGIDETPGDVTEMCDLIEHMEATGEL